MSARKARTKKGAAKKASAAGRKTAAGRPTKARSKSGGGKTAGRRAKAAAAKAASQRKVFTFGGGKADGHAAMKEVLGGKGANLAEMTALGIPVPPGFTISTEVCAEFNRRGQKLPPDVKADVLTALANVEQLMDLRFGDPEKPLLVSVRSGARASMPGMMDTVLNLGLNDETVRGLAAMADERFAYDSYRRFIQMYGDVVLGVPHDRFEHRLDAAKEERGVQPRHGADGRGPEARRRRLPRDRSRDDPGALSPGSARAALGRDQRGVRLLGERPSDRLSPLERHPRRLGHGGERPVHGVWQYGRQTCGDRRGVYARSVDG